MFVKIPMRINKNSCFLLSCFFTLLSICTLKAQFNCKVEGVVKQNGKTLSGAIVSLSNGSGPVKEVITGTNGVFTLILEPNEEYTVSITKPGYITSQIVFSTMGFTDEEAQTFKNISKPEISLFELPQDEKVLAKINDVLATPLKSYYYSAEKKSLVTDEVLDQSMQKEFANIEKIAEAAPKAVVKDESAINYQNAITKADKSLSGKDYAGAKKMYEEALIYKPSESYPKNQLSEINKTLVAQEKVLADAAREKEKLEKDALTKAAEEKRLAEQKALADAKEKERLEKETIAKAEKEKNLAEAKEKQRLEQEAIAKAAEEKRLATEKQLAEQKALADAKEKERLEKEAVAKAEEEKKLAEAKEKQRLEQEAIAKAAEEKRLATEKQLAEQKALADAKEKERLEKEAVAKAEEEKKLTEAKEKQRLEQEAIAKAAEEKRLATEKQLAEQKALADAKEKERLEKEAVAKAEEEKKLAEAKEKQRLEQEAIAKAAEEKRLAEEKQLAEQKALADAKEKERLEKEAVAKAEEERKFAEAKEKQRLEQEAIAKAAEEKRLAEEKVIAEAKEKQRLEQEAIAKAAEEKRLAEQKAFAEAKEKERLEQERLVAEAAEKKRLAEEAEVARIENNYKTAIATADSAVLAKNYAFAKTAFNASLTIKPNEQYPKDRILEMDVLIMASYTNELARKYPQGITEEVLKENNSKVTKRIVVDGNKGSLYIKKETGFGAVYYFKDGIEITEQEFKKNTEPQ
jgi:hypothetical protein